MGADALFPPPPCGEGLGVGVVPNAAARATPLYADFQSSVLNHPYPYPPHKGEGVGDVAPRLSSRSA